MILNKKLENYWLILLSLPSWECGLKFFDRLRNNQLILASLPSWECGLKYLLHIPISAPVASLPSWECGLKYFCKYAVKTSVVVTPFVGVWIEILNNKLLQFLHLSLPSWECGLKYIKSKMIYIFV